MKILHSFLFVGTMLLGLAVNAQKITEGDKTLSFLAGETKFLIEFNYDGMLVGKITEEEYKKQKIEQHNTKQPGKGDRWAEKWVNSRTAVYEPMFEELINKMLFKAGTNASATRTMKDAKYKIVVKTLVTEPGFNSIAVKMDPFCNFEISYVEIATGKVMAKGVMNRVPGIVVNDNDWDFDPSNRIKECYAKCGKTVGKTMGKALAPKK